MNTDSTEQQIDADEVSKSGFEVSALNSNDWWLHQIREIQNWSPGGVFVLFLGPVSCVAPAAAWFTTATGLIQLDGQPLFAQRLVVAPPGYGDSDYKGRFRASIENTDKAQGKEIPTDLLQALENPACFLEESDCDHVLAELEKLPEGSAVGICAAQRLRFHNLVPERGPEIKNSYRTHCSPHNRGRSDIPSPFRAVTSLVEVGDNPTFVCCSICGAIRD